MNVPQRILAIVVAAIATQVILGAVATTAIAETSALRGKLGTSSIAVQNSGQRSGSRNMVILYQGREFARPSAPTGVPTLHCCSFGHCNPITPNTALICDIVINCPEGGYCQPQ
jgi:hypothetical protein